MAGQGYKDFTAGAVLTAAQVDGYLMEQAVMNFAGTAARGSALSSVQSAGMMAHVGGGTVTVYDGSAWQQVYPASVSNSWTAYTPTWSSSGTAPAIGNGTLTGRYIQLGKLVVFRIFWQAGSTTTFGTGYWTWTLPVTRSTAGNSGTPVVNGHFNDNSLNKYSAVFSIFQTGANDFTLGAAGEAGNANALGATSPVTMANLDFIIMVGTYEAA